MFFQLLKKDLNYIFRNITLYLFVAIVVLFYSTQFLGDTEAPVKPMPGQDYYGSVEIKDKTEEMKKVYQWLDIELNKGTITKHGFINKEVKLTEENKTKIKNALMALSDSKPNSSSIEIKVNYQEYLKIIRNVDKELGGKTNYGDRNRKYILYREMTYDEALEDFNNILSKDKYTNAYGRLFADYMAITAGIFPIFLSAFVLTRDKRSNMHELIYSRKVKSYIYIASKYITQVFAILVVYLLVATHATMKFSQIAIQNNYIIDNFAFFKYTFMWILPTIMFTTALGMFLSILFGNGLIAVPIQFLFWITSLIPLEGDYNLSKILIRFNSVGKYSNYIQWKNDIMLNRIFYVLLPFFIVLLAAMLLEWKRGGRFAAISKLKKVNTLQL